MYASIFNIILILSTIFSLFTHFYIENIFIQFISYCASLLLWAAVLGNATENLAQLSGERVGALLNATFGNAAELIICTFLIYEGLFDIAKASITGAIIGNLLLVFGLSALCGGLKYKIQYFNPTMASHNSSLMVLSVVSLFIPALFLRDLPEQTINNVSLIVAVTLIICYILWLIFTLVTHSKELDPSFDSLPCESTSHIWSKKKSLFLLVISTAIIAFNSEWIVATVKPVAENLGWSEIFIGAFLLAIIGNAAEHSAAVLLACKNKMGIAVDIAVGSSLQIALFVAPCLVFISFIIGNPMNLLFTGFEISTIAVAALISSSISRDGATNWYEGILLLAIYILLGTVFFVQ